MQTNELLADIMFERTAKGVHACQTSSKELPRKLKSLLLVVDGQSPVSKFVPYLTNLLPLTDKFLELERLGYVQRINTGRSSLREQSNSSLSSGNLDFHINGTLDQEKTSLTRVLTEMEYFLTNKAGIEALPVLSNLKKMKSLEQLEEELPGYFNLLHRLNIDAADHALVLEQLISKK